MTLASTEDCVNQILNNQRSLTVVIEIADPVLLGSVSVGRWGNWPLGQKIFNHCQRGQTLTARGRQRAKSEPAGVRVTDQIRKWNPRKALLWLNVISQNKRVRSLTWRRGVCLPCGRSLLSGGTAAPFLQSSPGSRACSHTWCLLPGHVKGERPLGTLYHYTYPFHLEFSRWDDALNYYFTTLVFEGFGIKWWIIKNSFLFLSLFIVRRITVVII